jgi:hypothetical protein
VSYSRWLCRRTFGYVTYNTIQEHDLLQHVSPCADARRIYAVKDPIEKGEQERRAHRLLYGDDMYIFIHIYIYIYDNIYMCVCMYNSPQIYAVKMINVKKASKNGVFIDSLKREVCYLFIMLSYIYIYIYICRRQMFM